MKVVASVLALAACTAMVIPAHAATLTWTGQTTAAQVWDRPQGDFGGLSSFGYNTPYNVFQFTVSQSGSYAFQSTSTSNNYAGVLWDNYTFLYVGAFSPVTPGSVTNILDANDDNPTRYQSGFTDDLLAGTQYFFVTTGFSRVEFGTYADSITGPGSVITAAVPEPATYVSMLIGLTGLAALARRRGCRRTT